MSMPEHKDYEEADFETSRVAAIRVFEVEFLDGEKTKISAHFHDGGSGNFLNFLLVGPDGHQTIVAGWNVDRVKGYKELTSANADTHTARMAMTKLQDAQAKQVHEKQSAKVVLLKKAVH